MVSLTLCRCARIACLFLLAFLASPVRSAKLIPPAEAPAILDKIYSFDLDGAEDAAKGMQVYAGMADAAAARLYGLRGESRNTARFGVRAREHFLRAKALDPGLADSDLGLGLYNYYVDTLSAMARILRFFMGIPGGSKQEGVRLLEHAIADGVLTSSLARFYLAMNLHR